ncbi:ras-related protein Rab-20 isoform X2 [Ailuropoda melanoleuca]|uniref:ras-related protein Rab-20 isoform X1 n=1 Tax=Ailuropoda melanoleuca TaxID=9646 RepID=UPI0014947ED2|nr:ras-related protein Rab-20 isoform X1 [Ailuropoda melanoleuca]XP_034521362.1 ras-related protein Rab-20 isoform X2 [Ailuropoda melanoleuca]
MEIIVGLGSFICKRRSSPVMGLGLQPCFRFRSRGCAWPAPTTQTAVFLWVTKQAVFFKAFLWGQALGTQGREQFHGLGSMYCRGAAAVILTYDVNHPQSLVELEDRFLGLTDTANTDCLFAIVGNKVDLVEDRAAEAREKEGHGPGTAGGGGGGSPQVPRQVRPEDAVALYKKILKYKMLDEKEVPAAEQMCFETSAKTGYNVDLLFETLFDMVVPVILRQRAQGPPQTVDISSCKTPRRTRSGCCA